MTNSTEFKFQYSRYFPLHHHIHPASNTMHITSSLLQVSQPMHKPTTNLHLVPRPRMHGALYLHYTLLLGPERQQVRLDYWKMVILIPSNHTTNLTVTDGKTYNI